ncbi:hypothetical protein [Paenibacillus lutrae]|nr:hypothetical protein [Paenibacillus lutrae]
MQENLQTTSRAETEWDLADLAAAEFKRLASKYAAAAWNADQPQLRALYRELLRRTLDDQDRLYQVIAARTGKRKMHEANPAEVQREIARHDRALRELELLIRKEYSQQQLLEDQDKFEEFRANSADDRTESFADPLKAPEENPVPVFNSAAELPPAEPFQPPSAQSGGFRVMGNGLHAEDIYAADTSASDADITSGPVGPGSDSDRVWQSSAAASDNGSFVPAPSIPSGTGADSGRMPYVEGGQAAPVGEISASYGSSPPTREVLPVDGRTVQAGDGSPASGPMSAYGNAHAWGGPPSAAPRPPAYGARTSVPAPAPAYGASVPASGVSSRIGAAVPANGAAPAYGTPPNGAAGPPVRSEPDGSRPRPYGQSVWPYNPRGGPGSPAQQAAAPYGRPQPPYDRPEIRGGQGAERPGPPGAPQQASAFTPPAAPFTGGPPRHR